MSLVSSPARRSAHPPLVTATVTLLGPDDSSRRGEVLCRTVKSCSVGILPLFSPALDALPSSTCRPVVQERQCKSSLFIVRLRCASLGCYKKHSDGWSLRCRAYAGLNHHLSIATPAPRHTLETPAATCCFTTS